MKKNIVKPEIGQEYYVYSFDFYGNPRILKTQYFNGDVFQFRDLLGRKWYNTLEEAQADTQERDKMIAEYEEWKNS